MGINLNCVTKLGAVKIIEMGMRKFTLTETDTEIMTDIKLRYSNKTKEYGNITKYILNGDYTNEILTGKIR